MIVPTQGSDSHLLRWRVDLYHGATWGAQPLAPLETSSGRLEEGREEEGEAEQSDQGEILHLLTSLQYPTGLLPRIHRLKLTNHPKEVSWEPV